MSGTDDDPKTDPPRDDPEQDPPEDPKTDPPKDDDPPKDKTFTQADVDRIVRERIARERESKSDYADLKRKAAEADRLAREQETETEKRIREAREEAEREARAKIIPGLVMAEFRASAGGRIDRERLATLTEDLDLSRYMNEDGTPNIEKIDAKVTAWAPKEEPKKRPAPDPGQGARGGGKTSGVNVGREMFAKRRGKKPAEK